jgi:hypothetical protein
MSDPLATYLHDHLGGAKAAIDLLEAMRDRQEEQALRAFAANQSAAILSVSSRPGSRKPHQAT